MRIHLMLTVAALLGAGALHAEEVSVEQLKSEFQKNKEQFQSAQKPAAAPEKDMVPFEDAQLKKEDERLSQKELELLSKLGKGDVEAPLVVEAGAPEVAAPKMRADAGKSDLQASIEVRKQLAASQTRERELERQLAEARNRLLIAETEVERLSGVLEERNKASLAKYGGGSPNPAPRIQAASAAVQEDMPVATVVADKAHLRAGPTAHDSPLMTVGKGTRLAIEARNGEWYRVIAPTGSRAWVSGTVLSFSRGR